MTGHVNLFSADLSDNSVPHFPIGMPQETLSVRRAADWADIASSAQSDDVEIVLWKRGQPSPVKGTRDVPASEFDILTGSYDDILAGVSELFTESGWPSALRETVQTDVKGCLSAFEAKTPSSQYRVRLQAVSDDACRKFHQDRVFQRLIVTYRGRATVWRHADQTIENEALEMECVLLRGKRDGRDTKILHKSPVFTDGHPPRLIMVIDIIPEDTAL